MTSSFKVTFKRSSRSSYLLCKQNIFQLLLFDKKNVLKMSKILSEWGAGGRSLHIGGVGDNSKLLFRNINFTFSNGFNGSRLRSSNLLDMRFLNSFPRFFSSSSSLIFISQGFRCACHVGSVRCFPTRCVWRLEEGRQSHNSCESRIYRARPFRVPSFVVKLPRISKKESPNLLSSPLRHNL